MILFIASRKNVFKSYKELLLRIKVVLKIVILKNKNEVQKVLNCIPCFNLFSFYNFVITLYQIDYSRKKYQSENIIIVIMLLFLNLHTRLLNLSFIFCKNKISFIYLYSALMFACLSFCNSWTIAEQ